MVNDANDPAFNTGQRQGLLARGSHQIEIALNRGDPRINLQRVLKKVLTEISQAFFSEPTEYCNDPRIYH